MPTPRPISFSPGQTFDGNDGNWSSFIIRIGSPERDFRVLPSPAMGAVFVPDHTGCQSGSIDQYDCASRRGVVSLEESPGFQANLSQTWEEKGEFATGIEFYLGYRTNAYYGRDSVGLMVQNSGGPTLAYQLVGSLLYTQPFFVGFFGIGAKPFNFTNFNDPHPSYITSLRNENQIPSLSYGYTAGASYQSPPILGSLTLGGYDESRYEPSNITFPFDSNDERPTSLYLQHITADRTLNGSQSILQDSIYAKIDFTLPYLWLPADACDRIASYFDLKYDNRSKLYLIEEDTHAELVANRATLTFELGGSKNPIAMVQSPAQLVKIVMPYNAFALQASWPIFNSTTRYFPIRRGNESTYTLGRAFMQEAYVIVDYERKSFSVHQASYMASRKEEIVAIPAIDDNDKHIHLSKAAIAGIATGSIVFVVAMLIMLALYYRHKRQSHSSRSLNCWNEKNHKEAEAMNELPGNNETKHQLLGMEVIEVEDSRKQSATSTPISELPDKVHELSS